MHAHSVNVGRVLHILLREFSSEINLVSQQAGLYRSPTMASASSSSSSSSSKGSSGRRPGLVRSFRYVIPHIILISVYLLYLAIGGVVFSVLESPMYNQLSAEENAKMAEALRTKQIILEAYHNASMGIVKLEDGNITALLDSLIDTVNHPDWKAGRQKTLMDGRNWSFPSAMLFSMTTITTIGYGDLVPETVTGKAVCVIYSAIGIPYSFFLLADIGQLLALGFIRLIRWFNLCRSTKRVSKNKSTQTQRRKTTKNLPIRRFRGAMPIVTMKHLQSVRVSADHEDASERREINDRVNGMIVLGTTHEDAPSPNTNNSALDQSCPAICDETPYCNVTTSTTTFDEKKEHLQTKDTTVDPERECKNDKFANDDDEEDYPADEVSLILVFFTLSTYICISALAFSWVENWDYGTAFYFTFITLTTVGFGDIVPEVQYENSRFFFCLLFTVFGLAVTSMCIALIQDRACRAGRRLLGYFDCCIRCSKDIEEQNDSVTTSRDARCKEG
ncbi:TWiK family of potassium channels protein 7 isoform X2 [Strongylocentrotus purpuratus]|uniref:Potassium channel domain-containing protein n=1 Tax=Strongylocentrotus purpuratus TaxID=7668 RepID=A0A7M7NVZ0_STRPU|nr:TWiK family of potassium channels protein 7 isoform X2 [Strongylocentrotus purpuratus]